MAEALWPLFSLALLLAWLWREREHARERRILLQHATGAPLTPPPRRNRKWTEERRAAAERKRKEGR